MLLSKLPRTKGRIHFIGIGGIGMSGIAEVLLTMGYEVSGSDQGDNANCQRLRKLGANIWIGHDASYVVGAGVVVISSAIKRGNEELKAARSSKIPVVKRADMLAELMRFKRAIAVAGSHGKTTTTSLIAHILMKLGLDPTIVNGGILNALDTNAKLGAGEWIVTEADESDGSFLKLPADIGVITNIDPEHLDYYGDFETLKASFQQFIENLPFYGFAVMCIDHDVVKDMAKQIEDRHVISYGFAKEAMVRADNLRQEGFLQYFDLFIEDERNHLSLIVKDICLAIPGRHNVLNALAAIAVGFGMDIPAPQIKKALLGFHGVKRRFSIIGKANGATIIDDYAHHPIEIEAVVKTAKSLSHSRLIGVLQPHRYSRVHDLFDEFVASVASLDEICLAPIYEAGEEPIKGISQQSLAAAISKSFPDKKLHLFQTPNDLAMILANIVKQDDIVLMMGAGTITKWAQDMPALIQQSPALKG